MAYWECHAHSYKVIIKFLYLFEHILNKISSAYEKTIYLLSKRKFLYSSTLLFNIIINIFTILDEFLIKLK